LERVAGGVAQEWLLHASQTALTGLDQSCRFGLRQSDIFKGHKSGATSVPKAFPLAERVSQ
jgi:hypothetical protein